MPKPKKAGLGSPGAEIDAPEPAREAEGPALTAEEMFWHPVDIDAPGPPGRLIVPPPPEDDDPMDLIPGQVPIYNPLKRAVTLTAEGELFPVHAGGVRFVSEVCAHLSVGPDNMGGNMSRLGLRRLYGPEQRFAASAAKLGLSLEEYASQRNLGVAATADVVASRLKPEEFEEPTVLHEEEEEEEVR